MLFLIKNDSRQTLVAERGV